MKDANAEKSRLQWIDLFRGVAVLWMIETHTANTFLRLELLKTDWFRHLNYFNGLVAPAFLFIAGVLQGKREEKSKVESGKLEVKAGGAALLSTFDFRLPTSHFRFFYRIGQLLLIGYALHLPTDGNWGKTFSQIDILQCMAVAMLVGVLIRRLGKGAIWAAACLFVFGAPFASQIAPESVPVWLAGYLNRLNGALFPLFPWAGFFFAGWVCRGLGRWGCVAAAGIAWGAVWAQQFLPTVFPPHDYYLAGPGFFLERLGWMFLGMAGCMCVPTFDIRDSTFDFSSRSSEKAKSEVESRKSEVFLRVASWLRARINYAGRNSLAVYVIHLLLIDWLSQLARLMGWEAKAGVLGMATLFLAIATLSLKLTGWLGLLQGALPYRWLGARRASASSPLP